MSAEPPSSPTRPGAQSGRRSNSLVGGFIKRTRSTDLLGDRKSSNNLLRRQTSDTEQEPQSPVSQTPRVPPILPNLEQQPQLQTFGGENYIPKAESPTESVPVTSPTFAHGRTESMTNRGRYSYAISEVSSVNSPRRVRRRKDPTPYNVLVIGARNSGKTAFINFLKSSLAPRPDQQNARNPELDYPPPSSRSNPETFVHHYQEIELEHERIGLSIWDSKGFDKNLVDYQMRELSNFVESKFEDTFIEEMKVIRSPGYRDTHIHCVFFLFDPAQLDMNINNTRKPPVEVFGSLQKTVQAVGALDADFELQILKNLQGKTTVIPVISKADTVTTAHMLYLKKMVGDSFAEAGLDPLEALHFEGYDSEREGLEEIDEVEEEPKQEVETKQPEQQESSTVSDQAKDLRDATTTTSSEADNNEMVVPEESLANTKKHRTMKRDASLASVSTVMFDNGYMPMSILNPDEHALDGTDGPVGRKFVWGFADPYNPEHCDFVKLKETCFTEWRAEFREASREVFYERWRTGRLKKGVSNGVKKNSVPAPVRKASGGIPIELTARTKKYT